MKIFGFLYAVSLGVWITSLFIYTCYDNSIPMWISLVAMNVFNALRIWEDK